jgi:hypothetical protein
MTKALKILLMRARRIRQPLAVPGSGGGAAGGGGGGTPGPVGLLFLMMGQR